MRARQAGADGRSQGRQARARRAQATSRFGTVGPVGRRRAAATTYSRRRREPTTARVDRWARHARSLVRPDLRPSLHRARGLTWLCSPSRSVDRVEDQGETPRYSPHSFSEAPPIGASPVPLIRTTAPPHSSSRAGELHVAQLLADLYPPHDSQTVDSRVVQRWTREGGCVRQTPDWGPGIVPETRLTSQIVLARASTALFSSRTPTRPDSVSSRSP